MFLEINPIVEAPTATTCPRERAIALICRQAGIAPRDARVQSIRSLLDETNEQEPVKRAKAVLDGVTAMTGQALLDYDAGSAIFIAVLGLRARELALRGETVPGTLDAGGGELARSGSRTEA